MKNEEIFKFINLNVLINKNSKKLKENTKKLNIILFNENSVQIKKKEIKRNFKKASIFFKKENYFNLMVPKLVKQDLIKEFSTKEDIVINKEKYECVYTNCISEELKNEISEIISEEISIFIKINKNLLKNIKIKSLKSNLNNFYLIYKNKEFCGFLIFRKINRNYLHITEIFIKKEYRSQGIGTFLIENLKKEILLEKIDFMHKNEKKMISLCNYNKNEKSLNFYKKLNFIINKERIDEYKSTMEYEL